MDKISLKDAFARFDDPWHPRIVCDVNDMQIKIAKMQGEFMWHHHEHEDELFFVFHGTLLMRFRDRDVRVGPGEMLLVPRGVEHMPVGLDGCEAVMFEPRTTLNTGNLVNERTLPELERLA